MKKMVKMQSVTNTRWAFYEKLASGEIENLEDEFETLYYHYQQRGKTISKLRKEKADSYETLVFSTK